MSHRIFIAINLPELIKKEIVELQNKLKKFDWPVRWTAPENIHLTLRFLGSITDQEIEGVKQIISKAVQHFQPFTLSIKNFIVLPSLKMPHVICLNVENDEQLFNLQASIAGAIEEQGIGESEHHPFTGHITIGRMEPRSVNFRALTQLEFKSSFEVTSVEIMESALKPEGPVYSVVGGYTLQAV